MEHKNLVEANDVELSRQAFDWHEEEEEASHDKRLHDAVCQALVNMSNKDFPILLSTFYAQHVLSSTDSNIDMKRDHAGKVSLGNQTIIYNC